MQNEDKISRQRDARIDVIKAIGIVLMVFYHAGTPGKEFVYLFHMALFFMCSGYCYSHKSEDAPIKYIKRKIVTLYLPCCISGIIVACLHNFFLDIHVYSPDVYDKLNLISWGKQVAKCLAFAGGHQMLGANWFFRTLFFSSITYLFINKILKALIKHNRGLVLCRAAICTLLTSLGGYLGYRLSYGKYFNFLTVMILIDIGFLFKEYKCFDLFDRAIKKVLGVIGGFAVLLLLSRVGEISINSNQIVNPAFFAGCSLAGFVAIGIVADCIANSALKNPVSYIGQKSIWIMFFHYVGFKLFTLVEILVLNEPIDNLSAYPAHHTEHGLWALYGIFGVIIPILFVMLGKTLHNKLGENSRTNGQK